MKKRKDKNKNNNIKHNNRNSNKYNSNNGKPAKNIHFLQNSDKDEFYLTNKTLFYDLDLGYLQLVFYLIAEEQLDTTIITMLEIFGLDSSIEY